MLWRYCARIEGVFVSHRNKRSRGRADSASAELIFERALSGEEESGRRAFDPRQDRKTLQLCRQVQRALTLALSGECDDEVLRDVYVESVEPMGGPSQLLVRVAVPVGAGLRAMDVLARLNERSARLRVLVAQSICRKRAPGLSFVAIPAGVELPEGGRP